MQLYLLALALVASVARGSAKLTTGVVPSIDTNKPEIEPSNEPELPDLPDIDIFGDYVMWDCGWYSSMLPDCPEDIGCGDQPKCPDGYICRFLDKKLQCVEEKLCRGKLDICYVVDTSGSIGPPSFQLFINFLKDIIDVTSLGPDDVQVSTVRFSRDHETEVLWDLDDAAATDELIANAALDSLNHAYNNPYDPDALTCIWCGLEKCRTDVFSTTHGDRSDALNVVILLTDGVNNVGSYSRVVDEANLLKQDGARIVTVAVRNVFFGYIDFNQLNQVSSNGTTIEAESFSGLTDLIDDLTEEACKEEAAMSGGINPNIQ